MMTLHLKWDTQRSFCVQTFFLSTLTMRRTVYIIHKNDFMTQMALTTGTHRLQWRTLLFWINQISGNKWRIYADVSLN